MLTCTFSRLEILGTECDHIDCIMENGTENQEGKETGSAQERFFLCGENIIFNNCFLKASSECVKQ